MTWSYRIVKYRDPGPGPGFGLHEVYYDKEDRPYRMTSAPCSFACDPHEGRAGIIKSLRFALRDALGRDVLAEPKKWPGKAPA